MLYLSKQKKEEKECGGIDFFFFSLSIFRAICALRSRKEELCLCSWRAHIPHLRRKTPSSCSQFTRNQLPNSVNGLLAPPAVRWGRLRVFASAFILCLRNSLFFTPKIHLLCKLMQQVILLSGSTREQQGILHPPPHSELQKNDDWKNKCMYWRGIFIKNIQKIIPRLTSH